MFCGRQWSQQGAAMTWHHHDGRRRRRQAQRELADELRARGEEVAQMALEHARQKLAKPRRSPESAEERALKEARAAVARRLAFFGHLIPYLIVNFGILITGGFRPALVTAVFWGIGLACHGFFALVAPDLRKRWTETELQRRMPEEMSRNRRELEDRHAKHLEHLSASIAHEIRNPITAAKSLLQQMGEDPHSHENVEYAHVALQELERVERSISHLLRYARDEELAPKEVRFAEIVHSALDTLHDRVERAGVDLRVDVDEAGVLQGDPEKLRRVVINLVGNAVDALTGSHTPAPRVDVSAGENLARTDVWLRVRDNGPGIEAVRLEQIWTPFHTSKVNGTGLGLPITRKVVETHGGSIEVESKPGHGTEFRVVLPKQGLARNAQ
jgi:signal transduction histidine kinase